MYDEERENYRSYKGFNITSEPPFGFWVIRTFDNKDIPELNQKYTMVSMAVRDIDAYLSNRDKKKKK